MTREVAQEPAEWTPGITDKVMAKVDDQFQRRFPDLDPRSRLEIFRLFLREKHDPEPFYRRLAERCIADLPYDLAGRRILDLGCGRGYYTEVLRQHGAQAVGVDYGPSQVLSERVAARDSPGGPASAPPRPDVLADGGMLPFASGTFQGIFCSNVLEHTPEPGAIFDEIERTLEPGGWAWISWTNWYSPWGGHEITPLHYLGPRLGLRAHRRLYGEPRANVPFEALWPTHVGPVLRSLRERRGLRLVDAHPRYYPGQRWILSVPGLREVATWNCVVALRRQGPPA